MLGTLIMALSIAGRDAPSEQWACSFIPDRDSAPIAETYKIDRDVVVDIFDGQSFKIVNNDNRTIVAMSVVPDYGVGTGKESFALYTTTLIIDRWNGNMVLGDTDMYRSTPKRPQIAGHCDRVR